MSSQRHLEEPEATMAVSREQREGPTGEGQSCLSGAERKSEQGKASRVLKETGKPVNWSSLRTGIMDKGWGSGSCSTGPLVCRTNGHMLIGTQMPHLSR